MERQSDEKSPCRDSSDEGGPACHSDIPSKRTKLHHLAAFHAPVASNTNEPHGQPTSQSTSLPSSQPVASNTNEPHGQPTSQSTSPCPETVSDNYTAEEERILALTLARQLWTIQQNDNTDVGPLEINTAKTLRELARMQLSQTSLLRVEREAIASTLLNIIRQNPDVNFSWVVQKKGDVDVTKLRWSNTQTGAIGKGHVYLVSQKYTPENLEGILAMSNLSGRKVPATWNTIVRAHDALVYCGETTHTDDTRFTQHCSGRSGAPLLNLVTNALESNSLNVRKFPLNKNIVFTTDDDNDRMQGEAIFALFFHTKGGGLNLVSCGIRGSPCKELGQFQKRYPDKTVEELPGIDLHMGAFALSMANGDKTMTVKVAHAQMCGRCPIVTYKKLVERLEEANGDNKEELSRLAIQALDNFTKIAKVAADKQSTNISAANLFNVSTRCADDALAVHDDSNSTQQERELSTFKANAARVKAEQASTNKSSGQNLRYAKTMEPPGCLYKTITKPGQGSIGAYTAEERRERVERFVESRSKRVWTKLVKLTPLALKMEKRKRAKAALIRRHEKMTVQEKEEKYLTEHEKANRGHFNINKCIKDAMKRHVADTGNGMPYTYMTLRANSQT